MINNQFLINFFGGNLRVVFSRIPNDLCQLTEIRIRVSKPIIIKFHNKEYFVKEDGNLEKTIPNYENMISLYKPTLEDIKKSLESMSNYSLYAFEEEIRNGFITLPGGHRVGLCGQTVLENSIIKTIKNINGFNIRISHEIKGCAEKIINFIAVPELKHTIIISPPGCGKTTLLRDIVRILSNGTDRFKGYNIGVADERSEIGGCYMGVSQNDVGIRTDILDACPKAEGMIMLLRSMSPEIIVADEIGKKEDVYAIDNIINSGVKLICTVHGKEIKDILEKPVLSDLIKKNIFELFIILGFGNTAGEIKGVYNKEFQNVFV